jgi:ATP-dependent Lon protease
MGFGYFKANAGRISASIKAGDRDYHLHFAELHNTGPTTALTFGSFAAAAPVFLAGRSNRNWSCWAA